MVVRDFVKQNMPNGSYTIRVPAAADWLGTWNGNDFVPTGWDWPGEWNGEEMTDPETGVAIFYKLVIHEDILDWEIEQRN